jgi:hypothetical protein
MTFFESPEVFEAKDKRIHGADSGIGRTSGERALEIFSMKSLSWFFSGSQVNFRLTNFFLILGFLPSGSICVDLDRLSIITYDKQKGA